MCLYTGGQRLGDLATLKWDQIDLKNSFLFMTTQKSRRRMNKPIIQPLKEVLERRLLNRVNDYVFPCPRFAMPMPADVPTSFPRSSRHC